MRYQIRLQVRAVALCHRAKETPARGETCGLSWCPPVPPGSATASARRMAIKSRNAQRFFPSPTQSGFKIRKCEAFATPPPKGQK